MPSTIEQVRNLLASEPRDQTRAMAEAARGSMAQRLREAEAIVEGVLEQAPDDPDALLLHAEIASRMKSWDVAVVRWMQVLQRVSGKKVEARYHLAVAYRNTGSFYRAHHALDRVKSKKMSAAAAEEHKRLADRENRAAARIVGNKALEVLEAGDADLARSLMRSSLMLRGDETERVRDCLMRVVDGITEKPADVDPYVPDPYPVGEPRRSVFFCGFGWSGSGALFDYFAQSSVARSPFGESEALVFERHTGAKQTLEATEDSLGGGWRALIAFIFQSVLGVGGPPSMAPDLNMKRTLLAQSMGGEHSLTGLADACTALYREGAAAMNDSFQGGVENALRRFFDRFLTAMMGADEVAMANNCVHAQNIDLVRLISGATAVAVLRDPRDQYVARVYEGLAGSQLSCEDFIEKFRTTMEAYRSALRKCGDRIDVETVRFEEFVLSPSVRAKVSERIGVDPGSSDDIAYRPERDSAHNVGAYRNYSRQHEIAMIESELGEWLFDAA